MPKLSAKGGFDTLYRKALQWKGPFLGILKKAISSDFADQFGHMTAGRAARFATEIGVKHLLLTHLTRRCLERDVIQEAQRYFPGAVVVRDFDRFSVTKDRPVRKIEPEVRI